ncbi:homogentisate 1,2-dioxygenase [Pelomyxa schiedti]|nr:homogentisate 1,2-dioxygenase [Pelomyxa schiedti]
MGDKPQTTKQSDVDGDSTTSGASDSGGFDAVTGVEEHATTSTTTRECCSCVPTLAASYMPPRTVVPEALTDRSYQHQNPDGFIKVLALGEPGVGKSMLCIRCVDGDHFIPTDPEVDECLRKVLSVDGTPCQVDILDPGSFILGEGSECIRDGYIHAAHGFVIVYSITDSASFRKVRQTYDCIKKVKDITDSTFACVIVGNKVDLETKREVTVEQGVSLATSMNLPFFETCALTGLQVDDVFCEVARVVLQLGLLSPPPLPSIFPKCSLM